MTEKNQRPPQSSMPVARQPAVPSQIQLQQNIDDDSEQQTGDRTLFVGAIPFTASEDDLLAAFSSFGDVEDVKIIRDKFNNYQSKGYGFITFKSIEVANKVKAKKFVNLQGKKMNVSEAYRGGTRGGSRQQQRTTQGAEKASKGGAPVATPAPGAAPSPSAAATEPALRNGGAIAPITGVMTQPYAYYYPYAYYPYMAYQSAAALAPGVAAYHQQNYAYWAYQGQGEEGDEEGYYEGYDQEGAGGEDGYLYEEGEAEGTYQQQYEDEQGQESLYYTSIDESKAPTQRSESPHLPH